MYNMTNKCVVVAITGSIAAYKSVELVRKLREQGAIVRVVMTAGASEFITPLTLQAASGLPVHTDLFSAEQEAAMGHIELARWADFIVIAPASANTIAKIAHGMADDLLGAICLASDTPIAMVPAMNQQMWKSPATVANVALCKTRNISIWGPARGQQACGEWGDGRMLEPQEILAFINQQWSSELLRGLHVVITAGPTHEAIDPVRYLANRSSGKMGFALAEAAKRLGADVTLIAGPVSLATPAGVRRIDVTSANEMMTTVASIVALDIFIACAAVADYRPEHTQDQKIKKNANELVMTLVKNPDILAAVAKRRQRPLCVGFAAETHDVQRYAKAKLEEKNLDVIIANDVSRQDIGFATENNAVTVISNDQTIEIPFASKAVIAQGILEFVAKVNKEKPHDKQRATENIG